MASRNFGFCGAEKLGRKKNKIEIPLDCPFKFGNVGHPVEQLLV
jgi:hypothetical protein